MKSLVFLIVVLFGFSARSENLDNKPKENVVVNKKYDDNGNLIAYDSTYSYSYSYSSSDSIPAHLSQQMEKMQEWMDARMKHPLFDDFGFGSSFFSDPFFNPPDSSFFSSALGSPLDRMIIKPTSE